MHAGREVSVIVPLYNEEDSVLLLIDTIHQAMRPVTDAYEIVLVDDGSVDGTFALLEAASRTDPHLVVVKFRRNFGQTPAMAAGIRCASGRILVTMDGDLQNDPSDIPRFLEKIDEGCDLVVGWRHNRQDKLVSRKIPSKIANWLIGRITGVPIKDNGCSLKAYRASVFKKIPLYSDMHRFIPAISSLAGIRIAEIKVKHHARQFGASKYGLSRIYKVLLDLITIRTLLSCTRRPMWFFGWFAFGSGMLGLAFGAGGIWHDPLDFSMTSTALLFICLAMMLMFWGLVSALLVGSGDREIRQLSILALSEERSTTP